MVSRKMTIYLSGPIQGLSRQEYSGWREYSKKLLDPIKVLDPTRYKFVDGITEPQLIVEQDINDIIISDALLVYFDRISFGTAMEVRMAFAEMNKPVYVVDISHAPRSPWLVYHTTKFFDDLETACDFIRREHG